MVIASLISGVFSTVIGGVILAVLFFLVREKLFGLPDITGQWCFQIETLNTSYKPYEGMVLKYVAMLWREGNKLKGTVEKISEESSAGEREYVGDKRTRGEIQGYVEKNYF